MCREALLLADHIIPRQGVIWKGQGQWEPPVFSGWGRVGAVGPAHRLLLTALCP